MAELASLVQRLEVAVGRLEAISGPGGSAGNSAGGAVSAFIEAFDEIVSGPLAQYFSLSQQIGGDVLKHAEMMKQAFSSQRQLLMTASSSQKPSNAVLTTLLQPVSKAIQQVQAFREQNRTSPHFNHLSAVSESVPALGWVAMAPKPCPYVKEMQDAAMFYTNRVLKEYKDKDKTHVDWVKAYVLIWTELQNYIKQHHTTGLTWSKSVRITIKIKFICLKSQFRDCRLHVSDDQKTHKNPALREQGTAVRTGPKPFTSPPPRPAPSAAPACTLPPVFELDGKKWKVENHEGAQGLVIDNTELKQVVYAYKCNKSTLQVNGKINSITLDNCKKMGLVFDDVVGIVEIINCKDVKIQVIGKVPTISINKTDGCHVYLSKDSLTCEIVSAKSSEMNILVPNNDGEFTELPVPEQFKTVWDGQKLVTTSTEIAG
uniref:Adenylyl cyclase-associated protein n=1 Tax=Echeneis naucrates TaxID=173247 RepID=A0A665W800_ECHNA